MVQPMVKARPLLPDKPALSLHSFSGGLWPLSTGDKSGDDHDDHK